jgi:hypothetical protein
MDEHDHIPTRWERRRQEIERLDDEQRETEARWERDSQRRHRERNRDDELTRRCAALESRAAALELENATLKDELSDLRLALHEVASATSGAIETIGDSHFNLNKDTRDQIRAVQIETLKLRETFAEWREARADGAARPRIEDNSDVIRKTRIN